MNKVTEIIDKCIIAIYLAVVFAGVLYSTSYDIKAEDVNMVYTDIKASDNSENVREIMDAYDFLSENEKPADFDSIKHFLDDFKSGKVNKSVDMDTEASEEDATEEVIDSYEEDAADETDEVSSAQDDVLPEIDKDDWRLILVNKQNPLPEDYEVFLGTINGSLSADERIIGDIYDMLNAASADGVNLMICSAYRSSEKQTTLFNNKMNKLMGRGMSYLEAYKEGSMSVTPPGTSEHQLGLALDILTGSYTAMDDGFADTEAGKWLAANSDKYGFILRYPKGKEEITGIVFEPWHFRYVGKEYAREITEKGICLEEFLSGDY